MNDFEDPGGHYCALGCNKLSSTGYIAQEWRCRKASFMKLARRGNTNKTPTPESKQNFEHAMPKYRNVEQAIIVLGTPDANGAFPQRVTYGCRGEEPKRKLREDISAIYNCTAQEQVEQVNNRISREDIYKMRASNIAVNASMSILEKVSKKWVRVGQQSKRTHVLCARASVKGYTSTEIALEFRQYAFPRTPFDEKHRADNKVYADIMKKIRSYHKEWTSGKLTKFLELDGYDRMKAMSGKLVHLGSRGRKPVSEVDRVEADLLEYLEDCWEKRKRVTRNIIFWKELDLDPNLLGGMGSDNHMEKLKKRVYYGLKRQEKLSIRNIASVGQKLPPNWKENINNMRGGVHTVQCPRIRPYGTVYLLGVRDANFCNTDNVPIW